MMKNDWRWPKEWWCPRHSWPPAWARAFIHMALYHPYPMDLHEELKALEDLKKKLEIELISVTKRIDVLKKTLQEEK
ncbi:MAG: hypothetical protein QXH87_03330 [Candidatus Bathyarchaeia archaeon]